MIRKLLIPILLLLLLATTVQSQVTITGTASTSFKLDYDNTGAGVTQYLQFERGTSGSDAYLKWDHSDISFVFSHPVGSLTSRGRIVSSALDTFVDADTSPDISSGNAFKTGNTGATTIDTFDSGLLGQTIIVIFGDGNTTINFTTSNLIGNGGSDWTATANDMMLATYDGSDWYCDVAGGAGGGDATTLNGLASSQFLRSDTSDSLTSGTLSIDNGTILDVLGTLKLADTNDSHRMSVIWNENDTGNRLFNILLGGGDRSLTVNEDFTIGNGYAGTLTYSASSKTLTVEDSATIDQDIATTATPSFSGITLTDKLIQQSDTLTADDITPSVLGANIWTTANTVPTAISDFTDGIAGQCIVVIVDDNNTSFDFSSTNLKGNDGVDWSANQYDLVFATYDGTYWYCDISITTSDLSSGSTTGLTLVKCDASGGSYTYSVPTAVGKENEMYVIVKIDASANIVTVDPNGSETMNLATAMRLERRYQAICLVSDNANWFISSKTPRMINVKDFGAKGDGSTDDYNAILSAYNACSDGDTLYFPTGHYICGTALAISIAINIVGDGDGSKITQTSDLDLFVFTGSMERIIIRDIYLASNASTAGKAIVSWTMVSNSTIRNVTMHGSYYGLEMLGSLRNSIYDLRVDSTDTLPIMNTLVFLDNYLTVQSNANSFYGLQARGGVQICDNGIYFDGGGEGDINIINSHFEGTTNTAVELVNAISGSLISGCHFEGTLIDNSIILTGCANVVVQSCYISDPSTDAVILSQCKGVSLIGCKMKSLTIDGTNRQIAIKNCIEGTGTWDITSSTVSIEGVYSVAADSDTYKMAAMFGGISPYSGVNLVPGDMEVWTSGLPVGFTKYGTPTMAQETTITCFGGNSAKITKSGSSQEGLYFPVDATLIKDILHRDALNISIGSYTWELSGAGGATNEYYLLLSGGDPGLSEPVTVLQNTWTGMRNGTLGSLAAGYWDYGDNDSLGFSTLYVELSDSTDPDTKADGYVKAAYKYAEITVSAWFYTPSTNGVQPRLWYYDTKFGSAGIAFSRTFTIPTDTWTRCTATFLINPVDTSGRICMGAYSGSVNEIVYVDGVEIMVGGQASPNFVDGDRLQAKTPASAGATGTVGEVCWDTNYLYICVGANTWKRTSLSTW